MNISRVLLDLVILTKPRIIVLLLGTTLGAMVLAAAGFPPISTLLFTLFAGTMAAGGANAINHFLERDIDAVMARTRSRPLPARRISGTLAVIWGVGLNILAFSLLTVAVNLLSAALAMAGTLFYVFIYTLWLKRATPQNIVIGGAAGAAPPLVGWAAVTGTVELPAVLLFAIIFLWTPPHFWALAIVLREDYARAGVPMLPVVRGVQGTARQVLIYGFLLTASTYSLLITGTATWIYLSGATILNGMLLFYAVRLYRKPVTATARSLFKFSVLYLALLFVALMADVLVLS